MQVSRTAALLGLAGVIFIGNSYNMIGKFNEAKARRVDVVEWNGHNDSQSDCFYYTRGSSDPDLVLVIPDSGAAQDDLFVDNMIRDPGYLGMLRADGFETVSVSGRTVRLANCRKEESAEGRPERFWIAQEAELQ